MSLTTQTSGDSSLPAGAGSRRASPAGDIRALRLSDRQPLLDLLRETAVFNQEELAIALELIDEVLEEPAQEDYSIFVFCRDDIVLGYYCIGPTPATVGTFDLYWIAVKPDTHGSGIGTSLNAHAERTAVSRGGRLLIAETSSRPEYDGTRRFYLHNGYSELSRIRDYYRPGDDLVVYGKYLTS